MDVTRQGSKLRAANFCVVAGVLMLGCASQQDGLHDDVSAAAHDHHDRDQNIRPNRGPGWGLASGRLRIRLCPEAPIEAV